MNQQHQQRIRQRRHGASLKTLKGNKAYKYERLVINIVNGFNTPSMRQYNHFQNCVTAS